MINQGNEIVIKKDVVISDVNQIREVGNSLLNYSLRSPMVESKGAVADAITDYMKNLKETGEYLARFMLKVADALQNAAETFEETDLNIARTYSSTSGE